MVARTIVKEVVQAPTIGESCNNATEADPEIKVNLTLKLQDLIIEEIKNPIEIGTEKETITSTTKMTTRNLITKTLDMMTEIRIDTPKRIIQATKIIQKGSIVKGLVQEKMKAGEGMEIEAEVDLHIHWMSERKRAITMIKTIEIKIAEKKTTGVKKWTETEEAHHHMIIETMIKEIVNSLEMKEGMIKMKKEIITKKMIMIKIKNILQKFNPKQEKRPVVIEKTMIKIKTSQNPRIRNGKKAMFLMIKAAKV